MSKGTNPIKDEQWNQKVTKAADSFSSSGSRAVSFCLYSSYSIRAMATFSISSNLFSHSIIQEQLFFVKEKLSFPYYFNSFPDSG